MAITDLTGTKWKFNTFDFASGSNWSISGNFLGTSFDKPTFSGMRVNLGDLQFYGDPMMSGDNSWFNIGNFTTPPLMIEITGGTDATNASLIAWLTEHAAQVPTDLSGTKWVFNGTLNFPLDDADYAIDFTSNNTNYDDFLLTKREIDGAYISMLFYANDLDSSNVYGGSWFDNNYRIIEITGGTDATNADLIAWLMANAMQVPVADLTDTEWIIRDDAVNAISGNASYSISFSSNSTNYSGISTAKSGTIPNSSWNISYGNDEVYNANDGWDNQAYRTIDITGGTDASNPDLLVWLTQNATQQVEPEPAGVKNILFGTQSIDKILFGQSEVSKIYLGDTLVYEAGSEPPTVDPILENNSWATIKAVCEQGKAADYWNVGDTKNVTAGGYTRPVMIVDMSHGRTVFMFRNRTENNYAWDSNGGTNYSTSTMRTTYLASGGGVRTELLDAELSAVLTASSYKVATNGTDGTLLTLSDQLWLPAEKELTQTRVYSVQAEFDALTTFDYFVANDNNTARKCPKASAPTATSGNIYWERSPRDANSNIVCSVNSSGNLNGSYAYSSYGVAPCFAFTPTTAQTISFTIAGTTYQAEQGMTWAEWVASAYNTDGYVVNGQYIYTSILHQYVMGAAPANPADTISDGTTWTLATAGGGNN